jgi:putative flippase GtrA
MFARIWKEKWRMAKFVLVGLLNTGVDFAIFVILVYGFAVSTIWAQAVSYTAGVVNSYLWNRKWTFQAQGWGTPGDLLRFMLLNAVSFAAATALLLSLERWMGWTPAAAKMASVAVSLAVNYAGSRFWVFRSPNAQTKQLSD